MPDLIILQIMIFQFLSSKHMVATVIKKIMHNFALCEGCVFMTDI